LLRITHLTLARGARRLLEDASATIHAGHKVGLIGANGSGKSSLFALILGDLLADAGGVTLPPSWIIAHVAQETPATATPAIDFVQDGDRELREVERALRTAEAAHEVNPHVGGEALAELHHRYDVIGGYAARSRAATLLSGLGFADAQHTKPVASFSGGWRMRLNLAQALMSPSELLLLDEPTNHLDLDAIVWLEEWLRRYPGTLIVVSHDRDFLDGVVNVVVHIDARKLRRYAGNYSSFETQRAQNVQLAAAQYEKQVRERAHLQSFIDRFRAKATKARQAQSRMKMLAKMEDLAPLHAAAPFSFEFREPLRAPNPLLVLEDVSAGYGEREVLKSISLSLQAEQRIGLLGVNGAGKSTLIKTIAGALAPLRGSAVFNKGVAVGYFAQHQVEMLRDDESPLWHLGRICESGTREQVLRDYLGSFNFPGDMATGPVASFSGGEKARLALALIVWQRPNLLLLDEPTNHLDLETREALTVALAQFEGTLVLVSHDRHLLRATTEQLLVVRDGRVEPFDGDLEEYRVAVLQKEPARLPPAPVEKARQEKAAKSKNQLSRIKRLEELMQRLNERKAGLEAELGDPALYQDPERVKAVLADQAYVARELEALESEWLEMNA
jgi:ATP-binding cassette subfamily F protein 3